MTYCLFFPFLHSSSVAVCHGSFIDIITSYLKAFGKNQVMFGERFYVKFADLVQYFPAIDISTYQQMKISLYLQPTQWIKPVIQGNVHRKLLF